MANNNFGVPEAANPSALAQRVEKLESAVKLLANYVGLPGVADALDLGLKSDDTAL